MLRHSAAVAWLESGVHIKAVVDLLGHNSIAITGDIYGHTSDVTTRAAIDGLPDALGHIDGVLPQHLQGHYVEGALVGGGQHHQSGAAFAVGSEPVHGGDAPAVAGHEAGEPVVGHRRREVVPMERWGSRNSAVTTAQMECRPRSSGPVERSRRGRSQRGG
jgi:Phage integrase family